MQGARVEGLWAVHRLPPSAESVRGCFLLGELELQTAAPSAWPPGAGPGLDVSPERPASLSLSQPLGVGHREGGVACSEVLASPQNGTLIEAPS